MPVLSKYQRASRLYNIDEHWARTLKGLRVRVQGKWFNRCARHRLKEWFGGIITGFDNDVKMWKCRFDENTDKVVPF